MSGARIVEIAYDEHKPVKIILNDGIVYDKVYVEEFDGNEFVVTADDELIRKCHEAGRYLVCVLDPDEIESAEILEE